MNKPLVPLQGYVESETCYEKYNNNNKKDIMNKKAASPAASFNAKHYRIISISV